MSQSTFTSPISNNNNKIYGSKNHLFGIISTKLNQHNDKLNDEEMENDDNDNNLQHFANQFEKLQKKRKISYGDKAPTPSNSPAIHQLTSSHNTPYRSFSSHNTPNKRLAGLVSPLHLSLSRKIKPFTTTTPPVTPELHNNQTKPHKRSETISSLVIQIIFLFSYIIFLSILLLGFS